MTVPQKWMDHWFLRGMAGLLGFRNPQAMHGGDPFTAYFQYKIGSYQSDFFLYFMSPPLKFGYVEEVFQKMYEYEGFDLIRYIEFHYHAFEDKVEFIRWLRSETELQQRKLRRYRFFFWMRFTRIKARLRETLKWTDEEGMQLWERNVSAPLGQGDGLADVHAGVEGVLERIDEGVSTLLRAHSGRVVLYNQHHMDKLIQVFILLKDVQTSGKKRVFLFKSFSDTDMAAILRQFELLGDKKTNTLQVRIGEVKGALDLNDPAIEKFARALTEFFFP